MSSPDPPPRTALPASSDELRPTFLSEDEALISHVEPAIFNENFIVITTSSVKYSYNNSNYDISGFCSISNFGLMTCKDESDYRVY